MRNPATMLTAVIRMVASAVALVKTCGPVHGSVEFGLVSDPFAPGAGLHFVDEAGIQVGIDCHLLAGQGVESEAGGDFGGPDSAVANHDVLDGNQGHEQHKANNVVSPYNKLAKGLDDLSGCTRLLPLP